MPRDPLPPPPSAGPIRPRGGGPDGGARPRHGGNLFDGWTGRLFRTGIALAVLNVALIVAGFIVSPLRAGQFMTTQFVYIVAGREAAVFAGLNPPPAPPAALLFAATALQDLVAICIVAPLFVSGLRHVRRWALLRRIMYSIERTADIHRERVERGGVFGLILFTLAPALGSGPLVATLIGLTARMRPRIVLATTIGAGMFADLAWSFFSTSLARVAHEFRIVFVLLPVAMATVGIAWFGMSEFRRRRAHDHYAFVETLPDVTPEESEALRGADIRYVDQFLDASARTMSRRTGIDAVRIRWWQGVADLMHSRDLSAREAVALAHCGISSQEVLAFESPESIVERVNACEETRRLLEGGHLDLGKLSSAAAKAARNLQRDT